MEQTEIWQRVDNIVSDKVYVGYSHPIYNCPDVFWVFFRCYTLTLDYTTMGVHAPMG